MSDKIEAKIDLSTLFTATITVHEAFGFDDDGNKKRRPRLINTAHFLYAEAKYDSEEEKQDLIDKHTDVSRVYFKVSDSSTTSVLAAETPEEIDQLIKDAEEERTQKIIKTRLGIGVF